MMTQVFSLRLFVLLTGFALLVTGCGGGGGGGKDAEFLNGRLSLVTRVNELALDAVRNSGSRPTVTSRQLFLLSVAMYDAWTIYDPVAQPVYFDPSVKMVAGEAESREAERAVVQAAYHILQAVFPTYSQNTGNPDTLLASEGFQAVFTADRTTPEGLGFEVAQIVLTARGNDGSNSENDYRDAVSDIYPSLYVPVNSPDPQSERAPGGSLFDPNRWQPLRVPTGVLVDENGAPTFDSRDPTTFQDQLFLTPHFGAIEPFALTSGAQFRPPPPPLRNSSARYVDGRGVETTNDASWNEQVDEILTISANLTDREKVIAEFWADGPRSESPPGHWNQLAHGVSQRDKHSIGDDVKLYFALNAALFDTAISVWEAKRFYDYVRPASAIRDKYFGQEVLAWGGPNQGTQRIRGEDWRPYQDVTFVTPPFAEYVSGHSGFSHAAAEVLTLFTGSEQFFDGVTLTGQDVNGDGQEDLLGEHIEPANSSTFESNTPAEDVVLQWPTFRDAAVEAAVSRRFGGIHIQDGDLRARSMGIAIGQQAFAKAKSFWEGTRR